MTSQVKTLSVPGTPNSRATKPSSRNADFQLLHHFLDNFVLYAGRRAADLNQPDRRLNLPDSHPYRHMQYRKDADFQI
jgi:hypothetical protein